MKKENEYSEPCLLFYFDFYRILLDLIAETKSSKELLDIINTERYFPLFALFSYLNYIHLVILRLQVILFMKVFFI
jgi:hypothetical protein